MGGRSIGSSQIGVRPGHSGRVPRVVSDLHSHTTASDGELDPEDLVAAAAAAGVGVLAVTDHDTMSAAPAAMAAGERLGVRVIPGVELSVRVPHGSMHLLGYFRAPEPQPLADRLEDLGREREARIAAIVARLAALGRPISFERVRARAKVRVGRPHVAAELVAAGHVPTREAAFETLIGDGGPAWVPSAGLAPDEAVELVRASGGAAVLAHPASLALGTRHLAAFVHGLAARGLAGIEVHRPDHTPEQREAFARIARRLGLVAAGGSDFHRPDGRLRLGDTGVPPLPHDAGDRLLERSATVSAQ